MDPTNKSLYEYLSEFANERGRDALLCDESERISVEDTLLRVNALVDVLRGFGIRENQEIVFSPVRKKESAIVLFSLIALGAVTFLSDPFESVATFLQKNDLCDKIDVSLEWNENDLLFKSKTRTVVVPLGGRKATCSLSGRDVRETSLVVFTSGSTGKTKGVKLSQYAFMNTSEDTRDLGGYFPDDLNLALLPLHHVFGLSLLLTAIVTRHAIFFPKKVESEYLLSCIEKYKITRMNCVPSLYLKMSEENRDKKYDLSSLRYGLIGGASCTKKQLESIEDGLSITLVPVYGMTECMGISCANYRDERTVRFDGCGRVYSMNEVKIGEDGEILVKSPALLNGYWGETGEIRGTGFFPTGDLGRLEKDGTLFVTGRKKDIIIANGNNLSAVEIEQKILSIDGVKDAIVVGIEDEKIGEVPACMIVLKEGVTPELLNEQLNAVLSKRERPRLLQFTDSIPLTSSGKKDKQAVKRAF